MPGLEWIYRVWSKKLSWEKRFYFLKYLFLTLPKDVKFIQGFHICISSIFEGNNFCCVKYCLEKAVLRFTEQKILGMVTLKLLQTNCFDSNSKQYGTKSLIQNMKLNRIKLTSLHIILNKVLGRFQEKNTFFTTCLSICLEKPANSFQFFTMFLLSYCLVVWWWLQIKSQLPAIFFE